MLTSALVSLSSLCSASTSDQKAVFQPGSDHKSDGSAGEKNLAPCAATREVLAEIPTTTASCLVTNAEDGAVLVYFGPAEGQETATMLSLASPEDILHFGVRLCELSHTVLQRVMLKY